MTPTGQKRVHVFTGRHGITNINNQLYINIIYIIHNKRHNIHQCKG